MYCERSYIMFAHQFPRLVNLVFWYDNDRMYHIDKYDYFDFHLKIELQQNSLNQEPENWRKKKMLKIYAYF